MKAVYEVAWHFWDSGNRYSHKANVVAEDLAEAVKKAHAEAKSLKQREIRVMSAARIVEIDR